MLEKEYCVSRHFDEVQMIIEEAGLGVSIKGRFILSQELHFNLMTKIRDSLW
jgi:hypothetical protein